MIYPKTVDDKQRIDWLTEKSHSLKNYADAVNCLLEELKLKQKELGKKKRKQLNKIISFIDRHKDNMNYHKEMRSGRAVCSGINTVASRELIEERLCKPVAPWSEMGASSILALRTKAMSESRWSGFWNNIMENGTNQTKAIELRLD